MPYVPYPDELAEIISEMGLPELPEHTSDDDEEARDLILAYAESDKSNVYLIERVSYNDAKEYVNREDTHGPGWMVVFDLA
jgi:hypothetical protein